MATYKVKLNPFTGQLQLVLNGTGGASEPIEYAYLQKSQPTSIGEFQIITHTNTNNWDAVSPDSTRINMSSPNTIESSANISQNTYGVTINKSSRYKIVVTINGIWDAESNDWMQLVRDGSTALTWGQFSSRSGNIDGIAMVLVWQGNISSGDIIDIRVNGANTNLTNINAVSLSIVEIPTTANITVVATDNAISDLDNDTGVYTELSADRDEIFMKAKGKTAMTLDGAGTGVITKIKDGTNDRLVITETDSILLSPDNTTAITIDNDNIDVILEGKTVISLNKFGYNILYSPDVSESVSISNDIFRVRQHGANRFYSESTTTYMISPDEDTFISVANDLAEIKVNGTIRIRADTTGSYLKSPDENTYIRVGNTGIIHEGYTRLGSNAINIQQRWLSGTTTNTDITSIAHGVSSGDKILSIDVMVRGSFGGYFIPPGSVPSDWFSYYAMYWTETNIYLERQGDWIKDRPYNILITYKE